MSPEHPPTLRFDDYEIDPRSLELRRGAARVELSPQGVRLLAHLVERRGELVTREALYHLLWPAGAVDVDRGLNTLVRQVRIAIGDSATEPRFLRTYPRRGYRFLDACAGPAPQPRPGGRRRAWRLGGGIALGVCGIVALLLARAGPRAPPEWAGVPAAAREPLQLGSHLLRRPFLEERMRAEAHLVAAFEAAPASREVRAHLAELRLLQGRSTEAAALVGTDPTDPGLTAHEAFVAGNLALLAGDSGGAAEPLLTRAVALRPDDARYRVGYAFLLALTRRAAAARAEIARAYAGDPVGAAVGADAGLILLYTGDLPGAAHACETALQVEPRFAVAADCALAARRGLGQDAMALPHAARLAELSGAETVTVFGGAATDAERLARFLAWRADRVDAGAEPFGAALALAEAGRSEEALGALEGLAGRPRGFGHLVVVVEPRLAPLRRDPRFAALIIRLRGDRDGT